MNEVAQSSTALELELRHEFAVRGERSCVDEGPEGKVEQGHCGFDVGLAQKCLGAPGRQFSHEFQVAFA